MLNLLIKAIKELSMSDKYLFGVSVLMLINPTFAICLAVIVLAYFVYKIGKQVVREESKSHESGQNEHGQETQEGRCQ